jgi:hypothetical protein
MERLDFRTDVRGNDTAVTRVRSFLIAQGMWMTAVFAGLQLTGAFTIENYFVPCYFGLVVTALIFAPADRSERWWQIVRGLLRGGSLVLCAIVAARVLSVVQL